MEEVKQSVNTIATIFGRLSGLIKSSSHEKGSVLRSLLSNSEGVERYATSVISNNQFTNSELSTLLGAERNFGRHLSEVEQTVYEELGEGQLNKIQSILAEDTDSYNYIHFYLRSEKR